MSKSELVEKYIQQRATAEELTEIQALLESDADFKALLTFQLELKQAVKNEEAKALKARLQQLEKNEIRQQKKYLPYVWKIAAVLVVGLVLIWFINRPANYDRLYLSHFKPYPNIVVPTVRDLSQVQSDVESAFSYYDNQDYIKAAELFKRLYEVDQLDYANFYYAMAVMANQEVEQAIIALENPDWNIPLKYQNQTDWYLALAYLKVHNKEKSIQYLDKVIQADHVMAAQARKLKADID